MLSQHVAFSSWLLHHLWPSLLETTENNSVIRLSAWTAKHMIHPAVYPEYMSVRPDFTCPF